MNEVDTSQDTINAEFAAAEQAIGVDDEQGSSNAAGAGSAGAAPENELEREAQIAIAKEMIGTTLKFSIGLFANVSLDNKVTDEAAQAYAVLIIKYFPGGIFGLLDRYKEEIAAGTATFILIKAVSQAKAEQQKQEEENQTANDAKKSNSPSVTDSFDFNTEQGERVDG